ncbi:hypothetical protein M0811_07459 [Anaeramoeba ignava]|uniref:Uncharacterized protein n=1 Tax=Anaeramoeba ignava TaxID=1746090 RepID=A0A9Q0RCV0_ANAIG|nr:hypothetical protein M0811_07459 [Anaeramoeba ignava]
MNQKINIDYKLLEFIIELFPSNNNSQQISSSEEILIWMQINFYLKEPLFKCIIQTEKSNERNIEDFINMLSVALDKKPKIIFGDNQENQSKIEKEYILIQQYEELFKTIDKIYQNLKRFIQFNIIKNSRN